MTQLESHAITGNQAGWDFCISTGGAVWWQCSVHWQAMICLHGISWSGQLHFQPFLFRTTWYFFSGWFWDLTRKVQTSSDLTRRWWQIADALAILRKVGLSVFKPKMRAKVIASSSSMTVLQPNLNISFLLILGKKKGSPCLERSAWKQLELWVSKPPLWGRLKCGYWW